ncbi:MAG: GNAT family N-acetyltransferase [Gemmatimonadaceae bacterium]
MDSTGRGGMGADDAANEARVIADGERLAGEGIYLRLVEPGDCGEAYLSWLNDPKVSRFLETRWREQTDASIRDFVRAMRQGASNYLFAIVRTNDDRHIGNVKLGAISPVHRYADVSYFIGSRDAWGTGIATEAIRILTRFAFERVGLHRVQAVVNVGNAASARALKRAGFAVEGLAMQKLWTGEGWSDEASYGILRPLSDEEER